MGVFGLAVVMLLACPFVLLMAGRFAVSASEKK
jgi:hypothetical protein